jgi:DNA-binding transcriptional MerR regulator
MEIAKASETAQILGTNKRRLRELAREGLIPTAWRGKPVRYNIPKVLDWLDRAPTRDNEAAKPKTGTHIKL